MLAYVVSRTAWGIVPALALVTCIVFFVIPGDPPIREGRAPEPNLTTSSGSTDSVFRQYGRFV